MCFGILCVHFLSCRAHLPPITQFWSSVSISNERFRGKMVTFTSKIDLVITFGDYLLIISASLLPHCCQQSRLSCTYYLLKELKRKRPRLRPNNWKEATCLSTSKCQLMESASRLKDFIFKLGKLLFNQGTLINEIGLPFQTLCIETHLQVGLFCFGFGFILFCSVYHFHVYTLSVKRIGQWKKAKTVALSKYVRNQLRDFDLI